jgi:hypothetical protein
MAEQAAAEQQHEDRLDEVPLTASTTEGAGLESASATNVETWDDPSKGVIGEGENGSKATGGQDAQATRPAPKLDVCVEKGQE